MSNYETAKKQAHQVFSKFMSTSDGREAVKTMIERGKSDRHFRFLSDDEAKQVLNKPHNFLHQTVAWKQASHSTKVRHVSNPSSINKDIGSSLYITQKIQVTFQIQVNGPSVPS